jgi:hypothetical protein
MNTMIIEKKESKSILEIRRIMVQTIGKRQREIRWRRSATSSQGFTSSEVLTKQEVVL